VTIDERKNLWLTFTATFTIEKRDDERRGSARAVAKSKTVSVIKWYAVEHR